MADILAFGFINPESGDSAQVWQDAINSTIAQLATHNHNGTNSANISPASITPLTTPALAVNWVETPALSGNFTQTVTAPAAVSEVNTFYPKVYEDSTGILLYPSIVRAAANQITITTNKNVNMTVVWR